MTPRQPVLENREQRIETSLYSLIFYSLRNGANFGRPCVWEMRDDLSFHVASHFREAILLLMEFGG